ncbi:MAG: hypothetical protein IT173_12410 [Acidobacteria bacterium]|nr:hypothetical protein [Acidobacteriota bacterium]
MSVEKLITEAVSISENGAGEPIRGCASLDAVRGGRSGKRRGDNLSFLARQLTS